MQAASQTACTATLVFNEPILARKLKVLQMYLQRWFAFAFSFLALALVASANLVAQTAELSALDGEWIYFEDRTEGRTLEQLGPPMSAKFSLKSENGFVVLVSGHGSGHRNVQVKLDGSSTKVAGKTEGAFARYEGNWSDGTFAYETQYIRGPDQQPGSLIRREFRSTEDGLVVRVQIGSPAKYESVGLYRHAEDIPLPKPAKATISEIKWLSGNWVGKRGSSGTTSIEERWSPPLGGAILAISRTVSRERMSAFEYLRIVERDGGLVYVAQPGGGAPTEFVATEISETRAVFDNPRHDYPKRIIYDASSEGALHVSIGFTEGGTPRKFEFNREAK